MKERYIFDSEHLVYVKEKRTFAQFRNRSARFLMVAFSLGLVVWSLSYLNVIPSVQTVRLQKDEAQYISAIHNLDTKFSEIEQFLSDIQYHDDSCFRVLSKMRPLSADKRKASFGGTNKYEYLEGYFNSDLFITYNRKVDILANKLNLQEQSYESVIRSAKRNDDSLLSVPAILPVAPSSFRVSSSFGWRIHPIKHHKIHHDGLDMATNEGRSVYSSGNGIVVSTSNDRLGYGKQVVVDHGFGYKTRYAHLSKISVSVGDTVCRGSEVGKVGNSGISTGPHLHYEVISPDGRQNPDNYYVNDLNPSEYKEMLNAFSLAD